MFYLTSQERRFIAIIIIIFIIGSGVQLLLRRDIAPVRWAKSVRQFKININTARVDQFQMLPGVGATLAGRIVSYRQQYGLFSSVEDLCKVKGLRPKHLARIRGLVEL
jgi:competence ComEA-like helix-hairpin-helix protein